MSKKTIQPKTARRDGRDKKRAKRAPGVKKQDEKLKATKEKLKATEQKLAATEEKLHKVWDVMSVAMMGPLAHSHNIRKSAAQMIADNEPELLVETLRAEAPELFLKWLRAVAAMDAQKAAKEQVEKN